MSNKIVMLLISSCIIISCSAVKTPADTDFRKYNAAFKYVISHNEKLKKEGLISTDSLEATFLTAFHKELNKEWKLTETAAFLKADSIDNNMPNSIYKPWLKHLNTFWIKRPGYVICFSKSYGNYITAEVLANVADRQKTAERPMFGGTELYLFIFDNDNHVVKILKEQMNYN